MIARITFILFTGIFLFGSMVSPVDADDVKSTLKIENGHERSDTVTQTIKITQDMKDWIGTHFDRKVKGEYLSVSEIEAQKGRFFLKVLSGNGKVLRKRVMKSVAEAKELLKEINDGDLLINYIDKIIDGHSGGINNTRAYNNNRNGNVGTGQKLSKPEGINKTHNLVPSTNDSSKVSVESQNNEYPKVAGQATATTTVEKPGSSQQQSPQSKTHRETIANDTTESNKDKTPGEARSQTNKPEPKSTNTMPELVRKAEAGGADVNAKDEDGRTPLHIAASDGTPEEIKVLLDRGADIEAKDKRGWAPLHLAAASGKPEAIKVLLDCGADIDAKDNFGKMPLHIAAARGKLEAIKVLLDRGADIDAKNKYGARPLHLAASNGKPEAIKVLLDRGADIEAKDRNGWTASIHASERGNKAVIKLLIDASSQNTKIAVSLPFMTECDRLAAHPDASEGPFVPESEGPFGPEYPGAIYLNAIYRGDHKQIAEYDHMVIEGVLNYYALITGVQHYDDVPIFLQVLVDPIRKSIEKFSIVNELLGFFAVSYEHIYPQCMDSNPVIFKKTVQWDNVVTNGYGMEISRSPAGTQTYSYRINQRHAAAFGKLGGDIKNPSILYSQGKLTSIFSHSQGMTKPLILVADIMSGMRKAMRQHSCDSPLMQRLDKNMIEIFVTKDSRKAAKDSRKVFVSALATAESYTERLADFYIDKYVLPQQQNDVQTIYTEMHNNGTSMQDAIRAISGSVCGGCFDQLTARLHGIDAVHDCIDEMESIQITTADTVGILTESWVESAQNLAKPVDHYIGMLQTKIADYQADGLSEQESCLRARFDLLGETDRDRGTPERMIPDFDKDPGRYNDQVFFWGTYLRWNIFDKQEAAFDAQDHQNLSRPGAAQPDGNSKALSDYSKYIGQCDYFTVREEVHSKVR